MSQKTSKFFKHFRILRHFSYNSVFSTALITDDDIIQACQTEIGTVNCAYRACVVETKFIRFLAEWASSNQPDDTQYHAIRGQFDPSVSCQVSTTGTRIGQKECCGDYPIRFPYWPNGGERSCCNGVTYNAQYRQCCVNTGTVEYSC